MTESAVNVAREAKNIHQSLKELLKTKEPFDREVDFQRKNLRKRYLNLLLIHPYAKESKDVENHLWMQTSYAFISSYKQRITAIDRAIQNNARQQQQGQPRQNGHGPVEHRKLLQRFRQFLADEEKFWTQLVLRLRRSSQLNEAQPALVSLGLIPSADDAMNATTEGVETREPGPNTSNGRNHFQFPPEDSTPSVVPATLAERESRLAILTKALICLGDIARYRELYNEGGGRARAGHDDAVPARRGRRRGPGGAELIPRPRNYDKAQQCYEQARLLMPNDGNPSHQLAILASYQKDSFNSLVHYYRALCVLQPYDTAAENLGTVLSKSLEQWKTRNRREREKNPTTESNLAPRVRIEVYKEKIVVLHALWRVAKEKGLEKMESISRRHDRQVFDEYYTLVSARNMDIDTITNSIVLSQGALWKHRMFRDPSISSHNHRQDHTPPPPETKMLLEWNILRHVLDLHRALFRVGMHELDVPPPVDAAKNDLAQFITATFRRTLPALRIASKWVLTNFRYLMMDQEFKAYRLREKMKGIEIGEGVPNKISRRSKETIRFWQAYSMFLRSLSRVFPLRKLPALNAPLEEDISMRGFQPVKFYMKDNVGMESDKSPTIAGQTREQGHPNDEHLMRIKDLLLDGEAIVDKLGSPFVQYTDFILFNENILEDEKPSTQELTGEQSHQPSEDVILPQPQQQVLANLRGSHPHPDLSIEHEDDNMTEITSKTDDDCVREAFKFLDVEEPDEEGQDEEDEIVWDPRATVSPTMVPISPTVHMTPITPVKPMLSPTRISPRSPTQVNSPYGAPSVPLAVPPTTARDLLDDVLGKNRNLGGVMPASLTQPQSSAAHSSVFQSIWSASRDEGSLKFTGIGASSHIYQTPNRPLPGSSHDLSQSNWSSSFMNSTQNSQQNYIGAPPSAIFAPPPQPSVIGNHQRVPSASIPAPQFYPMHGQISHGHDSFAYGSPVLQQQQPIHRPLGHDFGPPYMVTDSVVYESSVSPFHSRHLSLHEPRIGQPFTSPPMSQVWGHVG